MEKFRIICGIDVSKAHLAVAILDQDQIVEQKTYANDAKGIEALYQTLLALESDPTQILVCLEHTGVYIEKLTMAYQDTGLLVWVVNSIIIKYVRVNFERLKTDRADARKIAQFAKMMQTEAKPYQPLDSQEARMKDLYRLRRQLIKLRQQVLNFASTNMDKAIPCVLTKAIFQQIKGQFNQLIKEVEAQLQTICKQDQKMKRTHQILRSIPGIGPVCAWQLIYTTNHFKRFSSYKQFASYAGIAPFEHQSGSSVKRKPSVSKKAAKEIKTNLTLAALRQSRKNMVFYQYYRYMKEQRNKHHLWIINSIRNMIIKLAFDLIKKDQLFDHQMFLINKKSWAKFLTLS